MFSSILVSFLLIGSTFAASELDQLKSLNQVNVHVKFLVLQVSSLYTGGAAAFQQTQQYQTFTNQQDTISTGIYERSNPNVQVTKSAEKVYGEWTTATINLLNEFENKINLLSVSPYNGLIAAKAVDKEVKDLFAKINSSQIILSEHKGTNLSIFRRLSQIVTTINPITAVPPRR